MPTLEQTRPPKVFEDAFPPAKMDSPTRSGFWGFPGRVFVIRYPNGAYAYYHYERPDDTGHIEKLDGLACFRAECSAVLFNDHVGNSPGASEIIDISFDEARSIAQSKPHLDCLMLCDDRDQPEVHYIR